MRWCDLEGGTTGPGFVDETRAFELAGGHLNHEVEVAVAPEGVCDRKTALERLEEGAAAAALGL